MIYHYNSLYYIIQKYHWPPWTILWPIYLARNLLEHIGTLSCQVLTHTCRHRHPPETLAVLNNGYNINEKIHNYFSDSNIRHVLKIHGNPIMFTKIVPNPSNEYEGNPVDSNQFHLIPTSTKSLMPSRAPHLLKSRSNPSGGAASSKSESHRDKQRWNRHVDVSRRSWLSISCGKPM